MLAKVTRVLHLLSSHRVCAWLVNTGFVLGKLTGFVHGNLRQGLHLVSEHRVCAW